MPLFKDLPAWLYRTSAPFVRGLQTRAGETEMAGNRVTLQDKYDLSKGRVFVTG